MNSNRFLRLVVLAFFLAGSACAGDKTATSSHPAVFDLVLKSTAFKAGKPIPRMYTCDGENVSPPLTWDAPPTGTVCLVLVVDDPDAPVGTWVHWLLYNLPPETRSLPKNVAKERILPNGARQGINDFKMIGYGGPCPPPGNGTHRYFFKLYALNSSPELAPGASRKILEKAMDGKIIGRGQLIGTYER